MSNRLINLFAVSLLVFVLVLTVLSLKNDSLTMDELAHLPAGYSYLTQQDMRLNPEHPPLIKDLAALPLLFVEGIRFPSDVKAWRDDVNGQWDFGSQLLFHSGNPTEEMIFWGRLPMVLVLLFLGFFIFWWSKKLWGGNVALLVLFLFSLSPTLLAHGRLVTTDVGAAAGTVLAIYFFLNFLEKPSFKNILWAGLALGLALLAKFSTILLLPFFGALIILWSLINPSTWRGRLFSFVAACLKFIPILIVASIVVWLLYAFHVWHYPPDRQFSDTSYMMSSNPIQPLRQLVPALVKVPILRPWAQYLLGLAMVFQRGSGGNTTYFLGEVASTGWRNYFPIIYAIKEPLAFFCLLILGLLAFVRNRLLYETKRHFTELAIFLFIVFYWLFTLSGNLNIGVRHLLPIFPLTIMLVGGSVSLWLKAPFFRAKVALLVFLLAWQTFSVLNVYPSFLAYFNELAGGADQAYIYVVDSNLDWGQDLKRLNSWLVEQKIDKIYVDYFGGSDADYYLGTKFLPWHSHFPWQDMTQSKYLAISVTYLQNQRALPVKGFSGRTDQYLWLDQQAEFVTKIGYSVFVYKVRP